MEIHTVDLQQMHVAGLMHTGDYKGIGDVFVKLHDWQEGAGLQNAPLIAVYYDDPHSVPVENLRSLAGVIVHDGVVPFGDKIATVEIPGGRYAMTSVVGDYSQLPKAWETFYGSVFGQGLKTKADLCFERYVNTPQDTDRDKLITELYAPLAE